MEAIVELTKKAQKQADKLPAHIAVALEDWTNMFEQEGHQAIRAVKGYHDEALSGDRKGQRSSRLSLGWRVIYVKSNNGDIDIIDVVEVNKHDYKKKR